MVWSGYQSLSCMHRLLSTQCMKWGGTATEWTQNLMRCWWRGWLGAVMPRAAAQVAGTQAQRFLKEGDLMKDRQGFSSSCVLPCCRMTGRSSLSRFTSHPLSCLFGAQTFFATGTAQWETVPTLVGSSFSGSCRYYHKANSSTPALEAVLLLTSPDQISGQTWGWR